MAMRVFMGKDMGNSLPIGVIKPGKGPLSWKYARKGIRSGCVANPVRDRPNFCGCSQEIDF